MPIQNIITFDHPKDAMYIVDRGSEFNDSLYDSKYSYFYYTNSTYINHHDFLSELLQHEQGLLYDGIKWDIAAISEL